MALSAKEKLIKALAYNGFKLDPEATRYKSRHASSTERVQNPNVYIKDATFGGTWRVTLGWTRSSGFYGGETDTLKRVDVEYRAAEADTEAFNRGYQRLYKLENFDRSRYLYGDKALWVVMEDENASKPSPVSKRAIKMVGDLELAVWLALEESHRTSVANAAREVERGRDRVERGKWEQSTLSRSEFTSTAYDLHSPNLERADGKTDLRAELAKVRKALDKLEGSLK